MAFRIDSRWVLSIAGRTTLVRLQTGPLFVAPLVNNFLARQLEQLVCPNDLEANQARPWNWNWELTFTFVVEPAYEDVKN